MRYWNKIVLQTVRVTVIYCNPFYFSILAKFALVNRSPVILNQIKNDTGSNYINGGTLRTRCRACHKESPLI